ncbi:hypothetical protein M9458_045448, partial [Cirrhinus mrigala]
SGHDYVTSMSEEESFTLAEEEFPALPVTPCKSPAAKKMASDDTNCIKQLINCRSDAIEQKISDLNGKVDAVTSELKSVAAKVMCLERRVDQVEQPISQMQRRMDDLETYMRRRNLKLIGIPEVADENIRLEVVRICQAVLPSEKEKCSEVVDVVHRLGKPQPGSGGGRPRATIIQFSTRTYRDAIWKAARNSSYLRDNGLQFREDFSKGDRERRMKLWPEVQKARAAGKTAYFVGARAFVQGE